MCHSIDQLLDSALQILRKSVSLPCIRSVLHSTCVISAMAAAAALNRLLPLVLIAAVVGRHGASGDGGFPIVFTETKCTPAPTWSRANDSAYRANVRRSSAAPSAAAPTASRRPTGPAAPAATARSPAASASATRPRAVPAVLPPLPVRRRQGARRRLPRQTPRRRLDRRLLRVVRRHQRLVARRGGLPLQDRGQGPSWRTTRAPPASPPRSPPWPSAWPARRRQCLAHAGHRHGGRSSRGRRQLEDGAGALAGAVHARPAGGELRPVRAGVGAGAGQVLLEHAEWWRGHGDRLQLPSAAGCVRSDDAVRGRTSIYPCPYRERENYWRYPFFLEVDFDPRGDIPHCLHVT